MKGYLIKDLLLVKNQKRSLPLLLVCGFFMSFSTQPIVSIIYLVILGTMICVGTISYDEMDRGYSFLLALPPSRKSYVREKFLFSGASCLVFMVLGVLIALLSAFIKGVPVMAEGDTIISYMCGAAFAGAVMISIMIPVRIRFGTERSTIVMFVLFAILGGASFLAVKGAGYLPASVKNGFLNLMEHASDAVMLPLVLVVSVLVILISERITERIMEGMEF